MNIFLMDGKAGSTDEVIEKETDDQEKENYLKQRMLMDLDNNKKGKVTKNTGVGN